METLFTLVTTFVLGGSIFSAALYFILRRRAERKLMREERRLEEYQQARIALHADIARLLARVIDDQPNVTLFQFPVRVRESSPDTDPKTECACAQIIELDEWRKRPPKPTQPRFQRPQSR